MKNAVLREKVTVSRDVVSFLACRTTHASSPLVRGYIICFRPLQFVMIDGMFNLYGYLGLFTKGYLPSQRAHTRYSAVLRECEAQPHARTPGKFGRNSRDDVKCELASERSGRSMLILCARVILRTRGKIKERSARVISRKIISNPAKSDRTYKAAPQDI